MKIHLVFLLPSFGCEFQKQFFQNTSKTLLEGSFCEQHCPYAGKFVFRNFGPKVFWSTRLEESVENIFWRHIWRNFFKTFFIFSRNVLHISTNTEKDTYVKIVLKRIMFFLKCLFAVFYWKTFLESVALKKFVWRRLICDYCDALECMWNILCKKCSLKAPS